VAPATKANLGRVARAACEHLTACPCEKACYRCLRDYWNQRDHNDLDKRLVLRHLLLIANEDPTTPPIGDLEEARMDSFLEAGFWRLVKGADLPLPVVQRLVRSAERRPGHDGRLRLSRSS
jgi:hypothetical protein